MPALRGTIDGMKKLFATALAAVCFTSSACAILTPNPHEHEYTNAMLSNATCTESAVARLTCACGDTKTVPVGEPLGHDFLDDAPSRIRFCLREGCGKTVMPDSEHKTDRTSAFGEEMKREMDGQYENLLSTLNEVGRYEANAHSYQKDSALDKKNQAFEADFKEYERAVSNLSLHYQYAAIAYHVDSKNAEAVQLYNDAYQYYNVAKNNYNGIYVKAYDSAFREYFYHGWTEEKIQNTLRQYGGYNDGTLTDLQNENVELTVRFQSIDPATNDDVLTIYDEFSKNNNQIALLLGYENYMEYAYEKVYAREYAYTDFDGFYDYVRRYLSPAYVRLNTRLTEAFASPDYTEAEKQEYNAVMGGSFFKDFIPNQTVNDFMQTLSVSKGETTYRYGERLENLFEQGDYYLGTYKGAYTWYLSKEGKPIVYFGETYQNPFTFTHEFGHYMNSVYNGGKIRAYDTLETHSQGLEMLYLAYLKEEITPSVYELVKAKNMWDGLTTIFYSTSVNRFEQAIYTGTYSGVNDEAIMADGKITYDEYDYLYKSILQELGVDGILRDNYWRFVTVKNPCYYISYAVSMACSLQFFVKAEAEGLAAASEAYLKTITYANDHAGWNYKQVLKGANLYTYDEEALFLSIAEYLT